MPPNSFLVVFNFRGWLRSFMVVLTVMKVCTRIYQTHKHTSVENELHNDYIEISVENELHNDYIEMLCNEYSHSFPRYQYFYRLVLSFPTIYSNTAIQDIHTPNQFFMQITVKSLVMLAPRSNYWTAEIPWVHQHVVLIITKSSIAFVC